MPSVSILAEPPAAVVDKWAGQHGTREVAQTYLEYLYSPAGQRLVAKHYYRPVRTEGVPAEDLKRFSQVELLSIDAAFGGWQEAQKTHFADGGTFDQIYAGQMTPRTQRPEFNGPRTKAEDQRPKAEVRRPKERKSDMVIRWKQRSVLPGFGVTMGCTLLYLCLIVLIPLSALFVKTATASWGHVWDTVISPRVLASFRLSLGASLVAAATNTAFGFLVAWMLVRYSFPGKRLVDAIVDLPFALPTAVSGIALTSVYAPSGWLGQWLEPCGIKAVFSPLGVTLALTFIGLPFVVRTVQPALADLDPELEEAAASLGADGWQTFRRVIVPAILPALLTGFALAFARRWASTGPWSSLRETCR